MCDKKFNRTASLQGTWNRNNISNISCFKASKTFEGTFYVISMQLQNLKEQRRTHVCVSFACGENIRFFVMSCLQIPPSIWKTNVQAKKSEYFSTHKWSRFNYLNVTTVERDSDLFFFFMFHFNSLTTTYNRRENQFFTSVCSMWCQVLLKSQSALRPWPYFIGNPASIGKGAGWRPIGRDREGRAWG